MATVRLDRGELVDRIKALATVDTQTLILRIETTADALLLWAIHCQLDKREVRPCFRWPANDSTGQAEFVTWLADLLWLSKRYPEHRPLYRGWREVFGHAHGSTKWHAAAHRQFLFVRSRYSLAHHCARGLDLSDAQRRDLMTLPTKAMAADRRQLQGTPFATVRDRLLTHAIAHPDRARLVTPTSVAERRARFWRLFVLSGRNQTVTTEAWHLLTGQAVTRQAVAKQLTVAAEVLRDRPSRSRNS